MKDIKPHKKYRYKGEVYSGKAILLARKYRKRDGLSFSAALVKAEVILERELQGRREQIREKETHELEEQLGEDNLYDLYKIELEIAKTFCLDCIGRTIKNPTPGKPDRSNVTFYHDPDCPSLIDSQINCS